MLDIDIEIPLIESKSTTSNKTKINSLDDFATNEEKVLAVPSIQNYINNDETIMEDEDFADIEEKNALKIYKQEDIQTSIENALTSIGKEINIEEYFEK
jgi:hypothetical protein